MSLEEISLLFLENIIYQYISVLLNESVKSNETCVISSFGTHSVLFNGTFKSTDTCYIILLFSRNI